MALAAAADADVTGGPMMILLLPLPPPRAVRPVYLILPPRMLGVLAQNAHIYTCGTSCGVGTSTHRPWSKHSHESLWRER